MPIDYKKYPPNWEDIRERILKRENNRCKFCGVENYAIGSRVDDGTFREMTFGEIEAATVDGDKTLRIVLTVAHLDHDEENWNVKDSRLAALCQRCHIQYDAKEKARRRKQKKAIGDLFDGKIQS